MEECIKNHSECKKKTTKPAFVPKRLLDLGGSKTSSVKLIEHMETLCLGDAENQIQYATLSYCWGSAVPMTTTKANKHEHETTGIDVQTMPATFQDAVYVAKKLQIPYLWIDALCIVQDDEEDWEAEAVTMCDIFAHSQITISAAQSSSSAENFLHRPSDEMISLHFRSTLEPTIAGQYFIRLDPRIMPPGTRDVENLKWKSRAWVWQEEVMSTRQAIFGKKYLQFRCKEECLLENDLNMRLNTSMRFWSHAVETFTSRALTSRLDRLKAIAGAAKFIEAKKLSEGNPERYLVGLWQNDTIAFQLCWNYVQPTLSHAELMELLQSKDERQYIAPSWSWASRNTHVNLPSGGPSLRSVIRVIQTDLRASRNGAMISVAPGSSITLSGKITRLSRLLSMSGHSAGGSFANRRSYRWAESTDYGDLGLFMDWVPKTDGEEDRNFEDSLYILFTTDEPDSQWLWGLLLAPTSASGAEVLFYYRVGTFNLEGEKKLLIELPEQELTIR